MRCHWDELGVYPRRIKTKAILLKGILNLCSYQTVINFEQLKWANSQALFPRSVLSHNKSSVILLLLKRVYLYWKYEFSRKCDLYFIKRIHSPVETFFNFRLIKSVLRIVLIKMCFGKFQKQESFLKLLRKMCKNY